MVSGIERTVQVSGSIEMIAGNLHVSNVCVLACGNVHMRESAYGTSWHKMALPAQNGNSCTKYGQILSEVTHNSISFSEPPTP